MPWPVRKIMSGSFYSNINDLGIVIIYASSLHILNYGDINWHECKLHIITLEKQTKKDNMNNAEKNLSDKNDDQLLLNDFIRAIINFLNWIS